MTMRDFLTKHDWLRIIIIASCSAYLFLQIYVKTETLLKKEMGFIEVTADADEMKFPSITFCPETMNKSNKVENITADYQNLPRMEDILLSVRQPISINR